MNIFKKIPEHIRKHPRKLLLRKSPVNAFRMMMDCRKLRTGIAPVSAGVLDKTPLSYDQLTLGYCFAEAAAGAYDTEYFKQYGHYYNPSPMFIGNMTKFLEGSFGVDNGATNAGAINALRQYGVCKDSEFTYGESNLAVMPPENVMVNAKLATLIGSYGIDAGDVDSIELAIANGYSPTFGSKLYAQFMSDEAAKTGIIDTPTWYQKWMNVGFQGCHAQRFVWYDRSKRIFRVRGSWNTTWGDHGDCYMGYDYIGDSNLVWDIDVMYQTNIGEIAA